MKLISINAGKEKTQINKGREEITGIYKSALQGPVQITKLGIEDDFIGSPKHHGGPDQALYVYGGADYQWWEQETGREMHPGMFGDNLTISDLECGNLNIGDFLYIGEVKLQVTSPRIPCSTFATRMEDPQWVKKFSAENRPGFYVRVLQEGTLTVEEDVRVEKYTGETLSLVQVYRDHYEKENRDEANLRKHLASPLSIRMREKYEGELQALLNT
ncbi:MAG: MOSC domain-containing protein [Anaerolineales bacterium]|nr:MOSC domain-containing protein [Anaerolineales bacterium]